MISMYVLIAVIFIGIFIYCLVIVEDSFNFNETPILETINKLLEEKKLVIRDCHFNFIYSGSDILKATFDEDGNIQINMLYDEEELRKRVAKKLRKLNGDKL